MRENIQNVYSIDQLPPAYTLFADVISKLSLQVKPIDIIVRFNDTESLANAVRQYVDAMFENGAIKNNK